MPEHTHEFDCIICGAHFDSEEALNRHDREQHEQRQAAPTDGDAEPIGNERSRTSGDEDRS